MQEEVLSSTKAINTPNSIKNANQQLPVLTPGQIDVIGEDAAKFILSQLIACTDIDSVSDLKNLVKSSAPELSELFDKTLSTLEFLNIIDIDGDRVIKNKKFTLHSENTRQLINYLPEIFKKQTERTLTNYFDKTDRIEGAICKYRSFAVSKETATKLDDEVRLFISKVDTILNDAFENETNCTDLYFLGCILDKAEIGDYL